MQNHVLYQLPHCAGWQELPGSVQRAIEIVDAPGSADSDGLAAAIEETPALARLVLRQMNSPLYAPQHPVTDVKSAVTGLGYEVIRNFIAGYMTDFLLKGEHPARSAFSRREYWQHALATCIAADLLGQKTGFENRFRLFTYGLIHDIGFVVLEAFFPKFLDAIHEKVVGGVPLIVAEKAVLGGITHADVGAWLCHRWGLDEDARTVVEYHHTPLLAPAQTPELLLLYLGNIVGTRVYGTNRKVYIVDGPVETAVLDTLGLTMQDMQDVDGTIEEELLQFQKRFVFA